MSRITEVAGDIVKTVLEKLSDRNGFDAVIELLDDEVKIEIEDELVSAVEDVLVDNAKGLTL